MLCNGVSATVSFIDIKSAAKAHSCENKIEERTLKTDYYESKYHDEPAAPATPTQTTTTSTAAAATKSASSLLRTSYAHVRSGEGGKLGEDSESPSGLGLSSSSSSSGTSSASVSSTVAAAAASSSTVAAASSSTSNATSSAATTSSSGTTSSTTSQPSVSSTSASSSSSVSSAAASSSTSPATSLPSNAALYGRHTPSSELNEQTFELQLPS
ncbi:hypothetical protein TYRP_010565 [Tyrophagus putrescentiae]|nr:hypothetical protein TYRP_010565 [Tyrophagus putrescentiae]